MVAIGSSLLLLMISQGKHELNFPKKNQTFQAFKDLKVEVKNYIGLRIKTLRTNPSEEYI